MTLKKFDTIKDFEDVKNLHRDIFDNLSFDDIKYGNLKTTAPTTDTLDKARMRLVEESGEPVLYIRSTTGDIYKFSGVKI